MEYCVRELGKLHLRNTYQFKHALDVIFQSFELEYKEDGIKSPLQYSMCFIAIRLGV